MIDLEIEGKVSANALPVTGLWRVSQIGSRSQPMKQSIKNKSTGTMHEMTEKVEQKAGRAANNPGMNRIGLIAAAVLLLLLGVTAPIYANQQDKDKERQGQERQQQHAQPRQQGQERQQQRSQQQQQGQVKQQRAQQQQQGQVKQQQRAQQQRAQQQQQGQVRQQQQQQRVQQQQARQPSQQRQRVQQSEQQGVWQQRRARSWQSEHRTWQQRGGYNGYRIPDDHFRGFFGQNHGFRIYSLPVMVVGGYPRFEYGGYWFSLIDPWPEYWSDNWYQNDDMYIDYYNDGYYLYNRRHPGIRIALNVFIG